MTDNQHDAATATRPSTRPRLRRLLVLPFLTAYACFCFATLAGPASAADPGSVTGTVRTNDGTPVADAHVVLQEIGRSAVTAADGTYSITGVALRGYTVAVTAPCRGPQFSSIAVDGAETH